MVGEEEENSESEKQESRLYHAKILTLLGKCYLEIGANEDSLELLEKRSQSLKLIKINTKKENLIVSDPYNFRHISHVGTETNGPIKFYDLMELKRNKYK